MAFTATTTTDFAEPRSGVRRVAAAIWAFIIEYGEARSRRDQIEALENLSDEDLAAIGITRDGIARHVFADTLHL